MFHRVLGEISKKEDILNAVFAMVQYKNRNVTIQIDPDDKTLEESIALAVEIVSSIEKYDDTGKKIIVKDLLETYNNGWNEYDEVQEDGSMKSVCNPMLTEDEFEKKLSLDAINITGNEGVDLWYQDSGLFWGHSVYVSSFEGSNFSEANAEIFG